MLVIKDVDKLFPICRFIDTVQSRDCTLAEANHSWLQNNSIPRHHCDRLKRDKMICVLPALISYCLHPNIQGQLITQDQQLKVEVAIYDKGRGEQALEAYKKFQRKEGLYGDPDALMETYGNLWKLNLYH